jgi:uncharacterized protein (DUF1501 family)
VNRLTCACLVAALISLTAQAPLSATHPNANVGTDHGWGSHHLVVGGATYGTFPLHKLSGPDDAGDRGNWIPTTSLDQYAATLGSWFDVPDADLQRIFPSLVRFSPERLGFL